MTGASKTWVWRQPAEVIEFSANFDYINSLPATGYEIYSDRPVDSSLRPMFTSRSSLKRFRAMHSPPFGFVPVVDSRWRDIIKKFVPEERIQFLPVVLKARGEVCHDFMYAIPFDRRICIDVDRSNVGRKIVKDDLTIIFTVRDIVHYDNCLKGSHMARDPQLNSHLVISNELKEALAATGQQSMFKEVEKAIY
jgi:hypothetical protein